MKNLEKIAYPLIYIFALVGVYYSQTDLRFYEGVYVREDGFIEWLSVVALVFGAMLAFYRAYILKPFRGTWFSLCLVFLGLLFLFGAGEEISWGQRVFGIESPEFFAKHNSQGETNLHNMIVGGKKINKIVFGTMLGIFVGIYFLIMPFLYRKVEKVKNLIDTFAIPVPKYWHIVAYLILVGMTEFIAGGKKGEILEFGGCWIFVLIFFAPYNRVIYSRTILHPNDENIK